MATYKNQKEIYSLKPVELEPPYIAIEEQDFVNACNAMKPTTVLVWIWILKNKPDFKLEFSPRAIGNLLGINYKTIQLAMQELEEKGYVMHLDGNIYCCLPNLSEDYIEDGKPRSKFYLGRNHSYPRSKSLLGRVEITPRVGVNHSENTSKQSKQSTLSKSGHPSDSLDGNFVSSERHPSGSLEHPTDAASLEAKPEQKKKAKQKKKKDRVREPNELSIEEKEKITKLYYEIPYQEIYERMNLRYNSLQYEDIERFKKEVAEYKKNMEKNILVSQLENQPDKLEKIAKYSECSVDEAKENIVKFKLDPDMLIDCFDGDDGGIYKRDYWLKESSNYTHWEWIAGCYNLQYNSSLNNDSVASNKFNSSVKTENSSVLDKDIDDMTDDDIAALIDSW